MMPLHFRSESFFEPVGLRHIERGDWIAYGAYPEREDGLIRHFHR